MRDITMSSSSRFGHKRRTGSRPLLNLWVAASVLVLASLSVSSPALPRSNFNGDWSVIVQSRGGACAPTVRYPVAITNGVVTNGGETPATTVQGRVAPNGTVRVTIRRFVGERLWPPDNNRRQRRVARAGHTRTLRGHMASG